MEELTFAGHNGIELFCRRWRPEGAPKAVLAIVHGHGEHGGRYANVADWFVPRGYSVYAFDLRGHGRSQGKRGALEDFGEYRGDVRAFLDLVREVEPVPAFLMGHSLGGLIALDYVLRGSDGLAGVVASGPVLSPPGVSPFLLWLSKVMARLWPSLILDSGLDTSALSRDPVVEEAYVNDPLVHSKGSARMADEMMRTIDRTQAHAAEMNIPCLILHGGEDRLCPSGGSRVFIDNVTFVDKEYIEYEGYFHEVYNDLGKEQVFSDLEAWLERHLQGGQGVATGV
jgi:alpha-beta hydrolase superfamily lysophospholipase